MTEQDTHFNLATKAVNILKYYTMIPFDEDHGEPCSVAYVNLINYYLTIKDHISMIKYVKIIYSQPRGYELLKDINCDIIKLLISKLEE